MSKRNDEVLYYYELLLESPHVDDMIDNTDQSLIEWIKSISLTPEILDDEELEAIIKIHLLIYDQSESGKVLITDTQYDQLMAESVKRGNRPIITVEVNKKNSRKWELIKHPHPNLVGSISKVYTKEDLYKWLDRFDDYKGKLRLAMKLKYDGVSSAVSYDGNDRYTAVTRKDGVVGQDITRLVENIPKEKREDLKVLRSAKQVKTEILMTRDDYERLNNDYPETYANRRSAVSGIINTPSNIHLAKYLTVKALVSNAYDYPEYYPCFADKVITYNPKYKGDVFTEINELIAKGKSSDNQFRVDGVVIYPISETGYIIGDTDTDVLESCIAFKTNSAFGITRALEVYPSVGRTGQVTPMLKVEPVEVNETIVTDVSLSTMRKFSQFRLHHLEKVQIESAGDVIPMVKGTMNPKDYPDDEPLLTMSMFCPVCGYHLTQRGELLFCENGKCPKVRSGLVTNFLEKMGINGIKDATVDTLQNEGYLLDLKDVIDLIDDKQKHLQIANIPGFSTKSVDNMMKELSRLTTEEFTYGTFFGSLGIRDISRTTARTIFKYIKLHELNTLSESEIINRLLSINGIGNILANNFADFIIDNRDLIDYLSSKIRLIPDPMELGKVVFTGFDDEELRAKFEEKGYLVKDNLTRDTTYVVAASTTTGKYKKAKENGIPVYMLNEVDKLLAIL